MQTCNTLAASVQAKKGHLYAVIQVRKDGKTKSVWRTLRLLEGTNKSKVNKAFREVVKSFEEEYALEQERQGRPASDIPIFEYMCGYLKKVEKDLQKNTYQSYHNMIYSKIQRYFTEKKHITVGNITPTDIEDFYAYLYRFGVTSNTVIHYHAILRVGFKRAIKDGLIDINPFDRIDRPKKNKFNGSFYAEEELVALLELVHDDIIYPAILLAGGLGLRRSEVLGVRWSRIDWDKKTVLLDTKIVEYKRDGKTIVEPQEEMKNKTSRRTLPLPQPVYEMLLEQKEKQDFYKRHFRKSYNPNFTDYVCVTQMGDILRPAYVTQRFKDLLNKYGLRHIRFHDLRHTFASLLLAKDVPLINVSKFLGHSDLSTTANIYAHFDTESKQASADVMTDILTKKSNNV